MQGSRGKLNCCWKAALILFFAAKSVGEMPVLEDPQLLPIETSACEGVAQPVPFAVDWNNDGRKDLLVGEMKWARVRLFLNGATDAEPFFPAYEYLEAAGGVLTAGIGCSARAYPQAVDWDNDGRKDLAVGTTGGHVNLYHNISADTVPVLEQAIGLKAGTEYLGVNLQAAPCITDWNGDGKKDLLLGSEEGTLSLFLNIKTDKDPGFGNPALVYAGGKVLVAEGGMSSPKHVDWDGDEVRDLLVGCGAGKVLFFRNEGTDTNPVFAAGESLSAGDTVVDVGGNSSIDVVDWNNDGGLDLLVGSMLGHMYVIKRSPPSDVDGDGLPDAWEVTTFGNLSHGPGEDADGDGETNREEYIAGTNPTDPQDVLRVTATILPATGDVKLSWGSKSGRTYQVFWCDGDLSAWQPALWPATQTGFGGDLYFTDDGTNTYGASDHSPGAGIVPIRFYRIEVR